MEKSLRTLLTGVLDYAGLYPPAALELDAAVRTYAREQRGADAWMLARFVCPAARLGELTPYRDAIFADGPPLALSIIARGGPTRSEFAAAVKQDLQDAARFCETFGERGRVESYEVRLPADAMRDPSAAALRPLIAETHSTWSASPFNNVTLFFEAGLAGDWRTTLNAAVEAAALVRFGGEAPESTASAQARAPQVGFKLRTGGLEPGAFPSTEQLATAILACRDAAVPLKFTAGLHHPLRFYDPGVRCQMHGFLNVYLASVLANTLPLEREDVQAVLEEQDPRNFHFTDELLGWVEADATLSEIQFARRARVCSFGSCSFDEPRADLQRLRLWS